MIEKVILKEIECYLIEPSSNRKRIMDAYLAKQIFNVLPEKELQAFAYYEEHREP